MRLPRRAVKPPTDMESHTRDAMHVCIVSGLV
jgi:hypothetical protein